MIIIIIIIKVIISKLIIIIVVVISIVIIIIESIIIVKLMLIVRALRDSGIQQLQSIIGPTIITIFAENSGLEPFLSLTKVIIRRSFNFTQNLCG